MEEITIKTSVSPKDFTGALKESIKIGFIRFLGKPKVFIWYGLCLTLITICSNQAIERHHPGFDFAGPKAAELLQKYPQLQNFQPPDDHFSELYIAAIVFVTILMLIPIFTFVSAYFKVYWKNRKIIEQPALELEYFISDKNLDIKMEKSSGVLEWNKSYQIIETRNWFMIYPNKKSAFLIHKSLLTGGQLTGFQEILKQVKGPSISIEGFSAKREPQNEPVEELEEEIEQSE